MDHETKPTTPRRNEIHPMRRRLGLIGLGVAILGLYVVASEFRPTEAAAELARAVAGWGAD